MFRHVRLHMLLHGQTGQGEGRTNAPRIIVLAVALLMGTFSAPIGIVVSLLLGLTPGGPAVPREETSAPPIVRITRGLAEATLAADELVALHREALSTGSPLSAAHALAVAPIDEDVLTYEGNWRALSAGVHDAPAGAVVRRRTVDGSTVWRIPTAGFVTVRFVDLTGDGRPELLTTELDLTGVELFQETVLARWTFRARSTSDGSEIWRHEVDERTVGAANVREVENAPMSLVPAGDVDGDGATDMLLETLDYRGFRSLLGSAVSQSAFGTILSGRTGAVVSEVTNGPFTSICTLCPMAGVLPIGEASGDGRPDVVLARPDGDDVSLAAASSDGAQIHWQTDALGPLYVLSTHLMRPGDALDIFSWNFSRFRSEVYDARTGTEKWTGPLYLPWFPLDADGDGGLDLVGTACFWCSGGIPLAALSGADGRTLWSNDVPLGSLPNAVPVQMDLSGDGVIDPVVAHVGYGDDTPEQSFAIDGRAGAVMWIDEAEDGAWPAVPTGREVMRVENADGILRLRTFDPETLAPRWAVNLPGAPPRWFAAWGYAAGSDAIAVNFRGVDSGPNTVHVAHPDSVLWTVR